MVFGTEPVCNRNAWDSLQERRKLETVKSISNSQEYYLQIATELETELFCFKKAPF